MDNNSRRNPAYTEGSKKMRYVHTEWERIGGEVVEVQHYTDFGLEFYDCYSMEKTALAACALARPGVDSDRGAGRRT